jgi:hypothetical protein
MISLHTGLLGFFLRRFLFLGTKLGLLFAIIGCTICSGGY